MTAPAPAGRAALEGAAIRLTGRDALGVLHRISTNALLDLAAGEARATLFCDFRGRLLHRAAVALDSGGGVWLIRPDAPPGPLLHHLERHVFREEVRADPGAGLRIGLRFGPPRGRGVVEERAGRPARVALPSGEVLELEDQAPADEPARIRAAAPRHGFEIRDAFNPYEVGLGAEVHLAKGCYTGQEVMQRLVTYGSVRRRLVRLAGTGPPPAPGAAVIAAGGGTAGVVTSAAPEGGGWIGLGVAARDAGDGAAVTVAGAGGARVEALPEPPPQGRG